MVEEWVNVARADVITIWMETLELCLWVKLEHLYQSFMEMSSSAALFVFDSLKKCCCQIVLMHSTFIGSISQPSIVCRDHWKQFIDWYPLFTQKKNPFQLENAIRLKVVVTVTATEAIALCRGSEARLTDGLWLHKRPADWCNRNEALEFVTM